MVCVYLPSAPGAGDDVILAVPVSRLVHIWSVPVEYLTRKYQLCALVTKRILVCIDPASAGFFMGTVRGELSDALRLSDLQGGYCRSGKRGAIG